VGSPFVHPKFAEQSFKEEYLLSGQLEQTNIGYAIAKIAGVIHFQGYRKQFGRQCISGMLTNLYGPNDNFDFETSHVLPDLIHKFYNAAMNYEKE
jgi:GDP-L-fucose synthase